MSGIHRLKKQQANIQNCGQTHYQVLIFTLECLSQLAEFLLWSLKKTSVCMINTLSLQACKQKSALLINCIPQNSCYVVAGTFLLASVSCCLWVKRLSPGSEMIHSYECMQGVETVGVDYLSSDILSLQRFRPQINRMETQVSLPLPHTCTHTLFLGRASATYLHLVSLLGSSPTCPWRFNVTLEVCLIYWLVFDPVTSHTASQLKWFRFLLLSDCSKSGWCTST